VQRNRCPALSYGKRFPAVEHIREPTPMQIAQRDRDRLCRRIHDNHDGLLVISTLKGELFVRDV
jgi:hypothetical protein